MLRKLLLLGWLLALVAPGWAQAPSVYHEVPPGCAVRPVRSGSPEGPIYDSRGFYLGYFRPLPPPAPAYVPTVVAEPERSFAGEREFTASYFDSGFGGFGGGFPAFTALPQHHHQYTPVNPLGLPQYQIGAPTQAPHHAGHGDHARAEGGHVEHSHHGGR